jgi:hypothetical protein
MDETTLARTLHLLKGVREGRVIVKKNGSESKKGPGACKKKRLPLQSSVIGREHGRKGY